MKLRGDDGQLVQPSEFIPAAERYNAMSIIDRWVVEKAVGLLRERQSRGVPLPTPSGFMAGSYGMVTRRGERFDIEIPAFSLDSPNAERTIN